MAHVITVPNVITVVRTVLASFIGLVAVTGADLTLGSRRWAVGCRAAASPRWARRITRAIRSRRSGTALVLISAVAGLPPLAAVSLAAGAAGQRRWVFAACCLAGRTLRFAAFALPAAWALSWPDAGNSWRGGLNAIWAKTYPRLMPRRREPASQVEPGARKRKTI